mmetsp:Transcript_74403/g.117747  ORF Transcript_74403/g.117747 Transcript_74403/m.117747 type:complete len:221 (-) Transcript_74403:3308-3970(-)
MPEPMPEVFSVSKQAFLHGRIEIYMSAVSPSLKVGNLIAGAIEVAWVPSIDPVCLHVLLLHGHLFPDFLVCVHFHPWVHFEVLAHVHLVESDGSQPDAKLTLLWSFDRRGSPRESHFQVADNYLVTANDMRICLFVGMALIGIVGTEEARLIARIRSPNIVRSRFSLVRVVSNKWTQCWHEHLTDKRVLLRIVTLDLEMQHVIPHQIFFGRRQVFPHMLA